MKRLHDNNVTCTGARFQFRENDYATEEGVNSTVTVVVEQTTVSLVSSYLKLTPMTYDQYERRAKQNGSGLEPLMTFHGSRPRDPAECKYNNNYYYDITVCNIILVMTILLLI